MGHDPKIDKRLSDKLDAYKVKVPEFSLKRHRWNRFIHWLASPAKNPLERLTISVRGISTMGAGPMFGALILAVLQVFLFK